MTALQRVALRNVLYHIHRIHTLVGDVGADVAVGRPSEHVAASFDAARSGLMEQAEAISAVLDETAE